MKRQLLLVASLLALAGPATAQMGPGGGRGFGLLEFDTNADGKLTKAEFDTAQRARFNLLDANKDGSATPEEIRTGMEAQAKARHEAAKKARFAELDKDKNGQVSQAEFLATDANVEDRGPRMRDGHGRGPMMFGGRGGRDGDRMRGPGRPGADGAPPPAPGAVPANQPPRAGRADGDKDGKLTFAEFSARANEAFTRADTNKDGTVTIAELQAATGPR